MKRTVLVVILLAQAVMVFTGISHASSKASGADLSTQLSHMCTFSIMKANGQLPYRASQVYGYTEFKRDHTAVSVKHGA